MKLFPIDITVAPVLMLLASAPGVSAFQSGHLSTWAQQTTPFRKSPTTRSIVPTTTSSTSLFMSDIPRDNTGTQSKSTASKSGINDDLWKSFKGLIPPPPEDQFTLMGDIGSLFIYSFSSHFINNFVVNSVIRTSDSLEDAVLALDPMQEITSLNVPVWLADQPAHIQQQVLTNNVQHDLLNHWSPLFSTAGTACFALCTCWLLAGYLHKAFLFRNTLDCDTSHTLVKTVETWLTCGALLTAASIGCSEIVSHLPLVKSLLGFGCNDCLREHWMTKADILYIVDSLTVLIAWRFIASTMLGYGRGDGGN